MRIPGTVLFILVLSVAIGFAVTCCSAFGQTGKNNSSLASRETIRARMIEFLRYVELDKSATPADVDKLVELWSNAAQADLSPEKRVQAFRDLYAQYWKMQGEDQIASPQSSDRLSQVAANFYQGGARLDLRLPEPRGPVSGNYLHVETRGRGPVQLLLISDAGIDGRELYQSFVERNKDRYTMHIVTLPGAGLAKQQPWPEVFDLTRRPWLNNIEQSLLQVVEKTKAKGKLVVVGTAIGGYFAARLALLIPERIRAAVFVGAQVNVPMRSRLAPDKPASLQERLILMKGFLPIGQFFPVGEVPADPEQIRKLLDDPNSSNPAVKNWMAFAVKNESLSKKWTFESLSHGFFMRGVRYGNEMQTTDLTEDLKHLSVPTLALSALHDAKAPNPASVGATQWKEIKALYPAIPLTLVTISNSRSYLSEDSPAEFDRALSDFLLSRQ